MQFTWCAEFPLKVVLYCTDYLSSFYRPERILLTAPASRQRHTLKTLMIRVSLACRLQLKLRRGRYRAYIRSVKKLLLLTS